MNTQIRQLTIERSSGRFRHAYRRRAMNKSVFSETNENDDPIDILTRFFAYISVPSAALVVAVAVWTIFVKN